MIINSVGNILSSSYSKIVKNNLILRLDALNDNSYPETGNVFYDLTINNIFCNLINGPAFNTDNGGSIVFDGIDDYAVSPTAFPSGNAVNCVAVWVRPATLINAANPGRTFMQLRYGLTANSEWYIGLGAITGLVANEYITIADASNDRRTSVADGGSLSQNTWYHLVFNFDTTTSQYKIYVNNVEKITVSSAAGHVQALVNPNKLYLGAFDGSGGGPRSFFNGRIATAFVYNRILTRTEITQNFNATRGRFGV